MPASSEMQALQFSGAGTNLKVGAHVRREAPDNSFS